MTTINDDSNNDVIIIQHAKQQQEYEDDEEENVGQNQQQQYLNNNGVLVAVVDVDDDVDDTVSSNADGDEEHGLLIRRRGQRKSKKKSPEKQQQQQQQRLAVRVGNNNNNHNKNYTVMKISSSGITVFLIMVVLIMVRSVLYLFMDTIKVQSNVVLGGTTTGTNHNSRRTVIIVDTVNDVVDDTMNDVVVELVSETPRNDGPPPPIPLDQSKSSLSDVDHYVIAVQEPTIINDEVSPPPTIASPPNDRTSESSESSITATTSGQELGHQQPLVVVEEPSPPETEPISEGPTSSSGAKVDTAVAGAEQTAAPPPPPGLVFTDDDYVVHVVYDDLRYRRVCAPVHTSILCLTIKYPFTIPLQDGSVPYVKPINDQIYTLTADHFHFIDGDDQLGYCISDATSRGVPVMTSTTTTKTTMVEPDGIKMCIDHHHEHTYGLHTVVGVWSRVRLHQQQQQQKPGLAEAPSSVATFYGVRYDGQTKRQRVHSYFNKQIVMIMGASPTPPIHGNIASSLFGSCRGISEFDGPVTRDSVLCYPSNTSVAATATNWDDINTTYSDDDNNNNNNNNDNNDDDDGNDKWTFLFRSHFSPRDGPMREHWIDPGTTVDTKLIPWRDVSKWDEVKYTIIVEHPIAHMQNQNTMMTKWEFVESLQDEWTKVFLRSSLPGQRNSDLAQKGVHIMNVIAFDGSPQFFPSHSGAYPIGLGKFRSEDDLLDQDGYVGWIPDYGTKCRGFLPPTSNLTRYNNLGRHYYEKNGLDMRWYGRTWEFINLVWFSVGGNQGYGKNGLDCTHGTGPFSMMHMYFLMAMVDDHYDNMEGKNTPHNSVGVE